MRDIPLSLHWMTFLRVMILYNFTWAGKNPADTSLIIRTRIDFFLTSRSLDRFVTSVDILPYSHSDHNCICLTFDFDHLARGPGYWHFNNELFKDQVFEAEIEGFWTDWKTRFKDLPNPKVVG